MSNVGEPRTLPAALIQHHSKYYALDHGVIFLVENKLFRIPHTLLLQSDFFRDMFKIPSPSGSESAEGTTDEKPICPEGVTAFEVESLLTLLNARALEGLPEFNLEEIRAILHIATKRGFEKARAHAISQIDNAKLPPLDRIELAFRCIVPKWLVPAYEELCTREGKVTLDEAQRLGLQRHYVVASIRELRVAQSPNGVPQFPPCHCGSQISMYCGYCGNRGYSSATCTSCGQGWDGRPSANVRAEIQKYKDELGLADD